MQTIAHLNKSLVHLIHKNFQYQIHVETFQGDSLLNFLPFPKATKTNSCLFSP
jgi:hypothetical protein